MSQSGFASLVPIEELTESQRQAVFHVNGALLVLAGPGSGKTRVIISRVAALINSGVNPYNICAITFTNKAAEEMRTRLSAFQAGRAVHISTFHSLCVRILRQYGEHVNIHSNFSIYDDNDQLRSMKEAIKTCHVDSTNFPPSKMLAAVSRLKNDLENPDAVEQWANDYFSKVLAQVYREYQRMLVANNAVDFDDLLVKTAFLLRDFPDIRSELGRRFKFLLVDEYQDTNHAQYQIAKGLALEHGNICVTGDPDQSIYRWRGANIGNILEFEKDWPDAVVVKLQENFRSTPNILELADKLISNNRKRKQKVLIPTRERGSDAVIKSFGDDKAESEYVADHVRKLIDDGLDAGQIAVFYRVNSMSRAIEESFVRHQIPYQVVRGVEFYSRKEIRDMLSYLKLIVNENDDMAFTRAIGTHPRGIGKTTLEKLVSYAKSNGLSFYKAAKQAERMQTIAPAARGKLVAFANIIEQFREGIDGEVAELMEQVFEQSGLADSLQKGGEKGETAIENVNELIDAAGRYDQEAEAPSLLDYLQSIALYSDTDAYDPSSGRVSLMTLHAAKGLEFESAFIIGLEDGILPHERSMGDNDQMEEERRLFFVGITRAKSDLNISFARYRMSRGQFSRTTPSKFLYEIGCSEETFEETFDSQPTDDDMYESQVYDEQWHFRLNELVEHGKFGRGRVKEFLNMGENSIVVVQFNSGKTKSLMVKYAKLLRPDR